MVDLVAGDISAKEHLRQVLQGSYAAVKNQHGLTADPPFCVLAILSNVMDHAQLQRTQRVLGGLSKACSSEHPYFVKEYVMEDLGEAFRKSIRKVFAVDGKFTLPAFYITISDPENGFRGNMLDGAKMGADAQLLQRNLSQTCLHTAHLMAKRYQEVGERVWWEDPIAAGKAARENLNDMAARTAKRDQAMEETSARIRRESMLRFQKARAEGYEVGAEKAAKTKHKDPLTAAFQKALQESGNLSAKKSGARRVLDAVRAGDADRAAFEMVGDGLEDWQKQALLEGMDMSTPAKKKVVEDMVSRVEEITAAYQKNMMVEANGLLVDIKKLKKLKSKKKQAMEDKIKARAQRLAKMPLGILSIDGLIGEVGQTFAGKSERWKGLEELYKRWKMYSIMATQGGEPDLELSLHCVLAEALATIWGADATICKLMVAGVRIWSVVQTAIPLKAALANSLMHANASLHLDALHLKTMDALIAGGGILKSVKGKFSPDQFGKFMDALRERMDGGSPSTIKDLARNTLGVDISEEAAKEFANKISSIPAEGEALTACKDITSEDVLRQAFNKGNQQRMRSEIAKWTGYDNVAENASKIWESTWISSDATDDYASVRLVKNVLNTLGNVGGKVIKGGFAVLGAYTTIQYTGLMLSEAGVEVLGKDHWLVQQRSWKFKVLVALPLALGAGGPITAFFSSCSMFSMGLKLGATEFRYAVEMSTALMCWTMCAAQPDHCELWRAAAKHAVDRATAVSEFVTKHSAKMGMVLVLAAFLESYALAAAFSTTWTVWVVTLPSTLIMEGIPAAAMWFAAQVGSYTGLTAALGVEGMSAWAAISSTAGAVAGLFPPTYVVVAVGALAIGGFAAYKMYSTAERHLRAGGNILLPNGWRMFMHDASKTMWFANRELGRLQNVFPSGTRFTDASGRTTADATIELGVMRASRVQKRLAQELGDAMHALAQRTRKRVSGGGPLAGTLRADSVRIKHLLRKWRQTSPRNGARILAEREILRGLLGDAPVEELKRDKVLRPVGDDAVASIVLLELSHGHRGDFASSANPLANLLRRVGKHAMYHDALSLQPAF